MRTADGDARPPPDADGVRPAPPDAAGRALKALIDMANVAPVDRLHRPAASSKGTGNGHPGRHRKQQTPVQPSAPPCGEGERAAQVAATAVAPAAVGFDEVASVGVSATVLDWAEEPADTLVLSDPLSSPPESPAADDGGRRPGWRHSYGLGLLLILVVQSGLALRLIWSNTAFQDEAEYLWFGHREWAHWLHGAPPPTNYLSGARWLYPPLGALADSAGGLAGARLLSLAFMLGATALLYATGSRLFSRRAALIGAAMFVAVGPTIDMSAWATYDPMAICVMALASWLAVRAAGSRASEAWIFLAAVVMLLADATKWVTVLWSPVIAALVILTAPVSWVLSVARGTRLVSYAVAMGSPALFLLGGRLSVAAVTTTTTGRAGSGDAWLSVLWNATPLVAVVLVLAVLGVVLAWRERAGRRPLLCALLVVAAVVAPIFQAYDQTTVSQYKHIVFGLWFGAMGAGYALSKAAVVNPAKGWRVGIAAAVFTSLLGLGQASGLYGWWPNSKPLMAAIERQLPSNGPILMQGGDQMVAIYYLFRQGVHPDILTSYAYSPAAISAMIKDHAVGMIETDSGTTTSNRTMQQSIAGKPRALTRAGYQEVARIRWRDANGDRGWFTIWQLGPKAG